MSRSLSVRMLAALAVALSASSLQAQVYTPPTPSTTNPSIGLPGPFPTTVTAANVNATIDTEAAPPIIPLNGVPIPGLGTLPVDSRFGPIQVSIPATGPSTASASQNNVGDIALVVGVADQAAADQALADAGFGDPEFGSAVSDGWRANHKAGIWISTVRQNGIEGTADSFGTPFPEVYGISNFTRGFSGGEGFNMVSGQFQGGGGNGNSDLLMHNAGLDAESAFNTAAAFFPYAEGWVGGWVRGSLQADPSTGVAEWEGGTFNPGTFNPSNPSSLPSYNVEFFDGEAPVVFPNQGQGLAQVDMSDLELVGQAITPENGMLFVYPTEASNENNIGAGAPNGSGWDVAIRQDSERFDSDEALQDFDGSNGPTFPPTNDFVGSNNSDFGFLYVPYESERLLGGLVGADGDFLQEAAATPGFDGDLSVERLGVGEYAISVEIDGTPLTEDDGMLILSVADTENGAFGSYEFDEATGQFLVNFRQVVDPILSELAVDPSTFTATLTAVTSDPNTRFPLVDTDFYVAWVDFTNPLTLPSEVVDPPSPGVIPEPVSLTLLGAGTCGLLLTRRRKA